MRKRRKSRAAIEWRRAPDAVPDVPPDLNAAEALARQTGTGTFTLLNVGGPDTPEERAEARERMRAPVEGLPDEVRETFGPSPAALLESLPDAPERREAAEADLARLGSLAASALLNAPATASAPPCWTLYAVTGKPVPLMGVPFADAQASEAGRERVAREVLRTYPAWGPLTWRCA